jgi:hypothetical protein
MRLHYAEDMPITARPRWALKSQDSRWDHPLAPVLGGRCLAPLPVELAFADSDVEPPEPPRSSAMNGGSVPDADM